MTDVDGAATRAPLPAWAWGALAAAIALRLAILALSPMQLYPDEAQYWGWAQDPAWGYYSKPPLIAWLIAATISVFGDAEWAVRLSAPLCQAGAAAALALLARELYGRAAGLLAGALWLSMPAVGLSSLVISTDAPLILLWSVMLLSLFRLRARPGWAWAVAFGASAGLGLLAKYAMIYAAPGLLLAAMLDVRTRAILLSRHGVMAGAACAVIVAPNLIWNTLNGMATLVHTAENADWSGSLVHPGEMIEFWASQLGAYGLILFPTMVAALVLGFRGRIGGGAGAALAAMAAPPLVIVSAQAFLAHAYVNWAFAACPAAVVLSAGLLTQEWARPRLRNALAALALAVNVAASGLLAAAFLSPAVADAAGQANTFKQTRGWTETTTAILEAAAAGGYRTVVFDDRFVFHAVDYYGRDRPRGEALAMWRRYEAPSGHAEACCALTSGAAGPILLVSQFPPYDPWFAADFTDLAPAGQIVVALGDGIKRRLRLFSATGFAPVTPRDGDTPPD
jgi:4-amino-4-deoxy-L-arabinose transferase-like glycosyltransferase